MSLRGATPRQMTGRVLTAAEITAHNTFEEPEKVAPANFKDFQLTDSGFRVTLSAKSVVVLELE